MAIGYSPAGYYAPGVRAVQTLLGALAALGLLLATQGSALAGWAGSQRIAHGVGGVTVLAQAPGDPDHLYIGNKDGLVQVYDLTTGQFGAHIFLDLLSTLDAEGDGGLLGMAFHPDFQSNGKFYVTITTDNGGIVVDPVGPTLSPYTAHVREYHLLEIDPSWADHEDWKPIIEWVKPGLEHTAGWLGFNPYNGYLHVTVGDGGEPYDMLPGHTAGIGNAQDIDNNLLGKVLRLDVNNDDFSEDPNRNYAIPSSNPFVGGYGDDEIFAYGLRNPWRASFDRSTGAMWIGDVGEGDREEVDYIPGDSNGGQNFGWRLREGADITPTEVGGERPTDNVDPVYDYPHLGLGGPAAFQGNSVTGGYIYRGPDPTLQGKYVFADFISRKVWMFDPANPYGTVTNITPLLTPSAGTLQVITTMFEDSVGNLYLGTLNGDVFRLKTDSLQAGDFQGDARVDANDLDIWQNCVGTTPVPGLPFADADGDGDADGDDFLLWQRNLGYNTLNLPPAQVASSAVPEPESVALLMASLTSVLVAARTEQVRRRR